jgi:hypothetical protein
VLSRIDTKQPDNNKARRKETSFTVEQVRALVQNLPSSENPTVPRKKRKVHYESDTNSSGSNNNTPAAFFAEQASKLQQSGKNKRKRRLDTDSDSVNDSSNNEHAYTTVLHSVDSPLGYALVSNNKRLKNIHYSPEIVVELYDRKGELCPIRALLDSGTTSTLILKRFVNNTSPKAYKAPKHTTWLTRGGTFVTRSKRLIEFSFPEFSTDKTISWVCHVAIVLNMLQICTT